MAKPKKCKECGWDGAYTEEEVAMIERGEAAPKEWVGTSFNLCNACAIARRSPRVSYSGDPADDAKATGRTYGAHGGSVAIAALFGIALAGVMSTPTRPPERGE